MVVAVVVTVVVTVVGAVVGAVAVAVAVAAAAAASKKSWAAVVYLCFERSSGSETKVVSLSTKSMVHWTGCVVWVEKGRLSRSYDLTILYPFAI